MAVLAVNAGSSSLKFSCYPLAAGVVQASVLNGNIQGLEPQGQPTLSWQFAGEAHQQALNLPDGSAADRFAGALAALQRLLEVLPGLPALTAVAHRVVHGGREHRASVVVTPAVLDALGQLNPLAPLHQPHNLAGIRAFAAAFPQLPQVACFDTAFHATLGPLETTFAIPHELTSEGVVRYGFHGLSYQFVMATLLAHTPRAQGRVLMAHLGNGASLCAAHGGKSVSTSMGFSALDGLMMGTRSGSLDAGVLLYLLAQGWDTAKVQRLLYSQSGLLGVSGVSADMRRLGQVAEGEGTEAQRARFAIDLFTHRVVREAGAMVATLQGLDVLAFSGGIGEHDAGLRARVAERLGWLGVRLDATANRAATGDAVAAIHAPDSAVEVWVIPTDEGRVAAEEAARCLHPVGE
jgi:acetate kinase